jgi:hypothetical protein
MRKALLIGTAAIEAATGLALLVSPSVPATWLFGTALELPVALSIGRFAGAAIFALGVAGWLARNDGQSPAAAGLIAAMLLYNIAAVGLLTAAKIVHGLSGVALGPGVILHAAMTLWCLASLQNRGRGNGPRSPFAG